MCGILGSINCDFNDDTLNLIKHRGPDRQAIVKLQDRGKQINFAHTRLSIVDLSDAGNQPMTSDDGNYMIIFNGEIYNHLDLRKEIRFNNYRGHSDTETLLHFLIEYGTYKLDQINGIFAFAFYDKIKGTILMARDRFGVKPIYYTLNGDQMIFSSEIRPIFNLFPTDLDEKILPVLMDLRYVPSPYTLFKGIYKLRPGHMMSVDLNKGLKTDIKPFVGRVSDQIDISFDKAVKEYGEKFEKAVQRQMMSDVELGVLLSGGIDSALVSAAATKYSNRKVKGFTVGFDSKYEVNEIEWARETAKLFNMDHHVVTIGTYDFFDIFEKCVNIMEEPIATISIIPMYYLSQIASDNVKVVLSGQGADEPLGGYNRYQGEILRDKYPSFLFNMMKPILRWNGTRNERMIRGANSLGEKDDVQRLLNVYNIFTKKKVNKLTHSDSNMSHELIDYMYNLMNCKSEKTSVERMMTIDMRMDLSDNLLLYTDKITMNFALECRVPMLDNELVSYIESLPAEYRVARGKTKIVHKAYAKTVLPDYIVNRKKMGFQSPTEIWFRENIGIIREMLVGKDSLITEYIDREELDGLIKEYENGFERDRQIFLLLSLNYWLKNIKRKTNT